MFRVDSVECPRRRQGWSQVADGRCSQAEEQIHPGTCVWNDPSTVKRHEVLRQSLTAPLDVSQGPGPAPAELWCGVLREGSPLLAGGWNYNPRGKEGEQERRGGEEKWQRGPAFT